jgi:hypothetical protein
VYLERNVDILLSFAEIFDKGVGAETMWGRAKKERGFRARTTTIRASQLDSFFTSGRWIFDQKKKRATFDVNQSLKNFIRLQKFELQTRRQRFRNRRMTDREAARMDGLSAR